jgi:hypothetical protein
MKVFLGVILWVWNTYTAFFFTELAIPSWYASGVPLGYTLIFLLSASTVSILGWSGIFSFIFWLLKMITGKDIRKGVNFGKLNSWNQRIQEKWTEKILIAMGRHRYLTLFICNLIPIPWLSTLSIGVGKYLKVNWLTTVVLLANTLKICGEIFFVYWFLPWLFSWIMYIF